MDTTDRHLKAREEVEVYIAAWRSILYIIQNYDNEWAHTVNNSIETTLMEISSEMENGTADLEKYRKILAGLKQGLRESPDMLAWLRPADRKQFWEIVTPFGITQLVKTDPRFGS